MYTHPKQTKLKWLQEKKRLQKEVYLPEDKEKLQEAGKAIGMEFEFNEDNRIKNYTDLMTARWSAREALLDSFGDKMDENLEVKTNEFLIKWMKKNRKSLKNLIKTQRL